MLFLKKYLFVNFLICILQLLLPPSPLHGGTSPRWKNWGLITLPPPYYTLPPRPLESSALYIHINIFISMLLAGRMIFIQRRHLKILISRNKYAQKLIILHKNNNIFGSNYFIIIY